LGLVVGPWRAIGRINNAVVVNRSALFVLLTALLALVGGSALFWAPTRAGFVTPPDRPGRVAIYRDDWGVPHVYAATDGDALYGVGYALAQDNLENILRAYLRILGISASVFGPDELMFDVFNRRWRINENARAAYDRLPAESRSRLSAYIAGVRRYLADHPEQRPAWMPPLEPHFPLAAAHSVAVLISVTQDRQGYSDCAAAGIRVELGAAGAAQIERRHASNQWAVMPQRTRDNVLMLWADSHTSLSDKFVSGDEVRIHGRTLHTAGIQAAGFPYPIIATTSHVAWAVAVGGPDVSDCYRFDVDPESPLRYRTEGESHSMESRTETFLVRGKESATVRFDSIRLNGAFAPVVARQAGSVYALSSSYVGRAGKFVEQLYAMNVARDIDEFRSAMAIQGMFPQNVMAGDKNGNSLYMLAGYTPIRPPGFDWSKPVSGKSAGSEWLGFHGIDDLVQIENPDAGYMLNTNIASDMMVPDAGLDASSFPEYIFNDRPGRTNERGLRAGELLAVANNISTSDLLEIGFDEKLYYTDAWQRALSEALLKAPELTRSEASFVADILGFDGYTHSESTTALQYYYWRIAVQTTAIEMGLSPGKMIAKIEAAAPLNAAQMDALIRGIVRATEQMVQRHSGVSTVAGEVFRIGGPENHQPVGGFGVAGESTLRAMSCADRFDERGQCLMVFGQRHPILTVFGDPVRSWSAVPRGQSRDHESPHYADQAQLASERYLKPTYLDWERLRPVIESSQLLERPAAERDMDNR